MRFTTVAFSLIVFIVIFSIFVANLASLIGIDKQFSNRLDAASNDGQQRQQQRLKLDDQHKHLMWFLQVSDIHISMYLDPARVPQLVEFCNRTVDIIAPSVVLASGDLTDAKTSNFLGSQQHEQEWRWYHEVLRDTNVLNKTVWLDIRGNHDNFNVPALQTRQDLFTNYSAQGRHHTRSYMHQVSVGGERYTFIAVDACLDPGPKRPFNFVGMLSRNETQHLINIAERSRELDTNYTIWFGHYPTSCILTPGLGSGGIRNLIGRYREAYAYLSGHFHTLGGAVPRMYTLQEEGFLELELGDWMRNRRYRLAAFDHGLFSFVDVHHNQWPVVLVTNPKDALFVIPGKEDLDSIMDSTHIRLLVFSPAKIAECQVKIDDHNWQDCKQTSRQLFVVPWEPSRYKRGFHKLLVYVLDTDGRSRVIEQQFTLDGSRLQFDFLAKLVLMYDTNKIFQTFFSVALIIYLVPLCVFRIWHTLVRPVSVPIYNDYTRGIMTQHNGTDHLFRHHPRYLRSPHFAIRRSAHIQSTKQCKRVKSHLSYDGEVIYTVLCTFSVDCYHEARYWAFDTRICTLRIYSVEYDTNQLSLFHFQRRLSYPSYPLLPYKITSFQMATVNSTMSPEFRMDIVIERLIGSHLVVFLVLILIFCLLNLISLWFSVESSGRTITIVLGTVMQCVFLVILYWYGVVKMKPVIALAHLLLGTFTFGAIAFGWTYYVRGHIRTKNGFVARCPRTVARMIGFLRKNRPLALFLAIGYLDETSKSSKFAHGWEDTAAVDRNVQPPHCLEDDEMNCTAHEEQEDEEENESDVKWTDAVQPIDRIIFCSMLTAYLLMFTVYIF
uniref:Calcineurin-like phosphoesterase domain-containing protein n=1 Tax=Anopheles farauti TaxID=69004 RepID=A0A182QW63_9DIPT